MSQPIKFDPKWAKAKQICRLNTEDIQMAKDLGMSPKTLMKNNPSPTQRWKLPVKLWIRELHEKRFGRRTPMAAAPKPPPAPPTPASAETLDENVPF